MTPSVARLPSAWQRRLEPGRCRARGWWRASAPAVVVLSGALLAIDVRAETPRAEAEPGHDTRDVASATVSGPSNPALRSARPSEAEDRLRWRRTWLVWDNAVTANTLGIGNNYQSANPTYETTGSFRPRYYLHDGDLDAVYAEGRIDLTSELTNSDVTTKEHEVTLSDATLLTGYSNLVSQRGDYETLFGADAPILTLPTSKFSSSNGTILGLGGDVRLAQAVPLAGNGAAVFKRLILRGAVAYNHTFTRAVVPSNPELRRVRMDPTGRTVPGDQLVGAAFPEHELHLDARALLEITSRLGIWSEVSYRPTWKYGFGSICVATSTGCAPVLSPENPSTYVVVTAFQAEVYYSLLQEIGISIGYVNVETQPGPDGRRRSIFNSPGAQFYVDVTAYLDAIYLAATRRRSEPPDGAYLRP